MNKKIIDIEDAGALARLEVFTFGQGKPGIVITAGIHGNEVTGVYAARRLIELLMLEPPINGSVTVIPCVNPTAMRCMQRRSPFDSEDMNRIFPGNATGSLTHKTAYAVWELSQDADMIVDLHCCGQHGLPYILSTYDKHPPSLALARSIPLDIAIRSQGSEGQFFTECCRRNQAALVIELPSGPSSGSVNLPVAGLCIDALLSLLRKHGIIRGVPSGGAPVFYGPLCDIDAPRSGLWRPWVQRGAHAEKGQVVGTLDGEEVTAAEACFITSVRACGYVFADEPWVVIYAVPQ